MAADVHALVPEVQRRVREATGVELRPELRMIGLGRRPGAGPGWLLAARRRPMTGAVERSERRRPAATAVRGHRSRGPVVLGLGWVASVSPIVAIEHVVVTGTRQLTVEQVVDAGAIRRGDSLVWFRAGHAADAIRALPYADAVTVTREWPHTVRAVTERAAVAWFAQGTTAFTTDGTGRALARVRPTAPPACRSLG